MSERSIPDNHELVIIVGWPPKSNSPKCTEASPVQSRAAGNMGRNIEIHAGIGGSRAEVTRSLRAGSAHWRPLVSGTRRKWPASRGLDRLTRTVEEERHPLANFDAVLEHERRISKSIDGRTVFDDRGSKNRRDNSLQPSLF